MTDHAALDAKLQALMEETHAGLADVLDIEAGLADVLITARRDQLLRTLDGVLDIDAGLREILPSHAPSSGITAFTTFATTFHALPEPERLAAATWLPFHALAGVRANAVRMAHCVDFADQTATALNLAERLAHHLDVTEAAVGIARELIDVLNVAYTLAHDGVGSYALANDIAECGHTGNAIIRAINGDYAISQELCHGLAQRLAHEQRNVLAAYQTRAHELAAEQSRNLTRSLARAYEALESPAGHSAALATALAHDQQLGVRSREVAEQLVAAVDFLHDALPYAPDSDATTAGQFVEDRSRSH